MPMKPTLGRMKHEDGELLPACKTEDYLKSTTKAKDALEVPQHYE